MIFEHNLLSAPPSERGVHEEKLQPTHALTLNFELSMIQRFYSLKTLFIVAYYQIWKNNIKHN